MITIRFKVRGVDLAALEAAVEAELLAFGGTPWVYDMEVEAVRYDQTVIVEWSGDVTAVLGEGS